MNDFLDINILNKWNELLNENNYNKKGRPFKIPGIIILYLAKLRELRGISFTSIYRRIRIKLVNSFCFIIVSSINPEIN